MSQTLLCSIERNLEDSASVFQATIEAYKGLAVAEAAEGGDE